GEHADLAVEARDLHARDLDAAALRAERGQDVEFDAGGGHIGLLSNASRGVSAAGELPGLLDDLADAADHVVRLLGQVVVLAVDDLLEALDRVLEVDLLAVVAREHLGDVEGLAEEALHAAGAADDQLVLLAELVHAEDLD